MRRLNCHHLHYFWAVAKEGNLTRAAHSLHVSQSALSTQIRTLEDELGMPLLNRLGHRNELTAAGARAARAAGMRCMGYAPHGPADHLANEGAIPFTSMNDLPRLLGL